MWKSVFPLVLLPVLSAVHVSPPASPDPVRMDVRPALCHQMAFVTGRISTKQQYISIPRNRVHQGVFRIAGETARSGAPRHPPCILNWMAAQMPCARTLAGINFSKMPSLRFLYVCSLRLVGHVDKGRLECHERIQHLIDALHCAPQEEQNRPQQRTAALVNVDQVTFVADA